MMTSPTPLIAEEAARPDYQRLLSPIKRAPLMSTAITFVVAVACVLMVGLAMSSTTYTAIIAVEPSAEAASIQLQTVLPQSGILVLEESLEPSSEATREFYNKSGLNDEIGLGDDVIVKVGSEGSRILLTVSADSATVLNEALVRLEETYLSERRTDLERGIESTLQGARLQLEILESRLATLGDQVNDQAVRGSLAYQKASLEAAIEVLENYPSDALAIRFVVVESPTGASGSIFSTVALGLVLAAAILAGLLLLLFARDDRIVSRRDLLRSALGAPVAGVLERADDVGLAAVASGMSSQLRAAETATVRLHPTSANTTELAEALRAELDVASPEVSVSAGDRCDRAAAMRHVREAGIDVVVIEWGRTRRRDLVSLISQLRFAGSEQLVVLVRSVPASQIRAVLE